MSNIVKPKKRTLKIMPAAPQAPTEVPTDLSANSPQEAKQKRCPKGEHRNNKTKKCEKLGEYKGEVFVPKRTAKRIFIGCSPNYLPTQTDLPRVHELNQLKLQQLKEIAAKLVGEPNAAKQQIMGARRISEFINLIVCIENEQKTRGAESAAPIVPAIIPDKAADVLPASPTALFDNDDDDDDSEGTPPVTAPAPVPVTFPATPVIIEQTSLDVTSEETEFQERVGMNPTDENETNHFLFNKEKIEFENNSKITENDMLYPTLDDPNFNIKLAKRKEFNDTKYDGTIRDIKKQSDILCNADFELLPHQVFVKNFLSFQTPYNALLLYHGLGTGKTCSAIGVAEEMRTYMRQVGIQNRILVVASPNVQDNFRLQLFNETKLKQDGDEWDITGCIGSYLLKEINPTSLKGYTREQVISRANSIINQYYFFMGYIELANYINRKINIEATSTMSEQQVKKMRIRNTRKYFNNRLVIIDEVHNIRITEDNKETKKTATLLMDVAKYAENMRLLVLSATPMYNSYREIIWITNLLNAVDKRSAIRENDVFDASGNFLESRTTKDGGKLESGRELLQRKLTGYVSYVRGENPFVFPYRIYPDTFSPEKTQFAYPTVQMNLKPITEPLKHVPIYTSQIGEYQDKCYDIIMNYLRTKTTTVNNMYGQEREMPSFENMESFGYTVLQKPLEALNIVYPNQSMDDLIAGNVSENIDTVIQKSTGKQGLSEIMTSKLIKKDNYVMRCEFDYKPSILPKYGRIFSQQNISKYSNKISAICERIYLSTGIVIVYSQFIDGGIVPLALALEEMGFSRYGTESYTKSLFKTRPTEPVDAKSMKPKIETSGSFNPAKYVMITGDKSFSPNNLADIKYATSEANKSGEKVKVILITRAGAEGLDFKNIRQIHIMEPWYNMNRIEQIIGRGVRNLSHCRLPFEERNVEIYLHATLPRNNEEPADMYVYRFAEKKAFQIGKITRVLKEIAVDCILNIGQTNFTVDKIMAMSENNNVELKLSSMDAATREQKKVVYKIGDKPFTDICDYMDNCSFVCSPTAVINETNLIKNTYNEDFVKMNYAMIVKRVRQLFKEQGFYQRDVLIRLINILRTYPVEQIDYALSRFIDNRNEYLTDKLGRSGYLVNRGDIYAFQPVEITDESATILERTAPVDYKPASYFLELDQSMKSAAIATAKSVEPSKQPPSVAKPVTPAAVVEESPVSKKDSDRYQKIILSIKSNLKRALLNEEATIASDPDWYKHANDVVMHIIQKLPDVKIDIENITEYVVYHNLDTMPFNDRFFLVQYLFDGDDDDNDDTDAAINSEYSGVEEIVKSYFDTKIIESNKKVAVVLVNDNSELKIYLKNTEKEWKEMGYSDEQSFKNAIRQRFVRDPSKYNTLIGFIHPFKEEMVFKTKDLRQKRNNFGAYCKQSGKKDLLDRINEVMGANIYNEEFIKHTKIEKGVEIRRSIFQTGLCVILEMVMRKYNETGHQGKEWFMNPEETIYNEFVKYKKT